MYYTYIVKCGDNTLYCGYTSDVQRRVREHNEGVGAKYTKARLPVELLYYEEFENKSQAMKRECAIKKLKRAEKLELIANNTGCCIKQRPVL